MIWLAFWSGTVIGAAAIAFLCFLWMCWLDWQEMKRQEGRE